MGNTIGRIGDGPKVIVYDSHIDTVGIGERDKREWDPFEGKVEGGMLYARGGAEIGSARLRPKEETKATTRCIPLEQLGGSDVCIHCDKPAQEVAIFAKVY